MLTCVCITAMGLSSKRVSAEEADWQRSVLYRRDQDHFGERVRHGVPGERWVE